jgi:hypothetical protein
MDLRLSWDLFIIVFFGIVVAYSFIIGRNNIFKVILGTYVAALGADALGNIFSKTLAMSSSFMKLLKLFSISTEEEATLLIKIVVFIGIIVLLSVRGSYNVDVVNSGSMPLRVMINMMLGFLNACLIVSIALIFISGSSLILADSGLTPAFKDIYNQSQLAKILIDNYSVWFLLPAASFLGMSLFTAKAEN